VTVRKMLIDCDDGPQVVVWFYVTFVWLDWSSIFKSLSTQLDWTHCYFEIASVLVGSVVWYC
jgi:hypothetical protein